MPGEAFARPTIGFGKGWARFDFQSTVGLSFLDNVVTAGDPGTPILFNTVLQYHVERVFLCLVFIPNATDCLDKILGDTGFHCGPHFDCILDI